MRRPPRPAAPLRAPRRDRLGRASPVVPGRSPAAADAPRSASPGARSRPVLGGRPVYLAGFGNDRRATGVHDDLWARAIALGSVDGRQRIVLVSVDLIGVFRDDVLKARALFAAKSPGATLLVASTHVHEGPDTMGLWGKGRFSSGVDPEYLERVRRTDRRRRGRGARRAMQPARLVVASARTPGLVEDGRLPRVIDDTIVAVRAIGADGTTLGTLVDWSSHPEALGGQQHPRHLRLRPLPPRARRAGARRHVRVRRRLDRRAHDPARPEAAARRRPRDPEGQLRARAGGRRARRRRGDLGALRAAPPAPGSTALEHRGAVVYVPLENRLFRLGAVSRRPRPRPFFSSGRPATTLFGDDLETEVGYLRIGDLEALLVPGEIYPELVLGGIQDPQDPGADFPGAPRERAAPRAPARPSTAWSSASPTTRSAT